MKKQDQPSMSWVPENQASFIAGRGWKSSNCSSLPVEGQKFSLTFPFIEQAISFKTPAWGILSAIGIFRPLRSWQIPVPYGPLTPVAYSSVCLE